MTHTHRRRLLAVLLTGQFMANIDIAIVNVAGPAIRPACKARVTSRKRRGSP
jgi:hypothetical protein